MKNDILNNGSVEIKRGLLIDFEGLDRSGKSTVIEQASSWLYENGIKNKVVSFPCRNNETGRLLDRFLKKDVKLGGQEAVHLIFTANRWEMQETMKNYLVAGNVVLLDRYSYSGLPLKWTLNAESGLLKPDHVLYFDMDPKIGTFRSDYGNELYEHVNFQTVVREKFKTIYDSNFWTLVNAELELNTVTNQVKTALQEILKCEIVEPLKYF